MKELYILKILDLFKGVYKAFGVNYEIMRLIVNSKLIMDARRGQNTLSSNSENKDKNYFYISLIVYGIIGLFSAPIVAMDINPMIKMSLYFSLFMVLILSVFISDFSTIILDINDKDIIVTKGVDAKTLNAAKITHIFIYLLLLSLAICGGGLVASTRFGIKFVLLFLVSILLIDILMIIITAIMYFIILKLFSGEKLKDMLNTFQIVFLLIFVVGFQFVGNTFEFVNLQFIYEPKIWNIFIPPMWFASNFSLINKSGVSNTLKIMSILSLVVPIISIYIYIKLIPKFEYNLQKLSDNTYKNKNTKEKMSSKISKIICKTNKEKAFFDFLYNVLSKDRDFKTKVYPTLAMGAVMPFVMLMSMYDKSGIVNYIENLRGSSYYLMGYMCVLMSQTIITTVKFSNQYEAAWIYDVLPLKDKSDIYTAMFKASIYKLVVPIFVFMSIGFIFIFGPSVIIHLVVMFAATILSCMFTFKFNEKTLPFSCEYKNMNSTSNLIILFKSMLVLGVVGIIHLWIQKSLLFTTIYLIALLIVIKSIWKNVFIIDK